MFCQKLLKYYCVPDSSPQEFLNLWIPFLQSFKHYWEKEKSLVARQKIATLQAERLRATPTQPLSHNGLVIATLLSSCTISSISESKTEE